MVVGRGGEAESRQRMDKEWGRVDGTKRRSKTGGETQKPRGEVEIRVFQVGG